MVVCTGSMSVNVTNRDGCRTKCCATGRGGLPPRPPPTSSVPPLFMNMKFKVMIFWAAAWRGRQARTPDTAPQARIISFLEVELSNFVPPQPKRFFCVFESVLHFLGIRGAAQTVNHCCCWLHEGRQPTSEPSAVAILVRGLYKGTIRGDRGVIRGQEFSRTDGFLLFLTVKTSRTSICACHPIAAAMRSMQCL